MAPARSWIAESLVIVSMCAVAPGQTTARLSVDSGGAQSNGDSNLPSVSADGRYTAFESVAGNLVAGDTNARRDVFVRDRVTGTTERVSVGAGGAQANHDSSRPSVSADGRFVAFESSASNLVAGDTNGSPDVFVRDRQSGTTERVSVDSSGDQAISGSQDASISGDGRYVAFWSLANDLVPLDSNGQSDVFVRDRTSATTERASVGTAGVQGNGFSAYAAISGDGRYVAFESAATNLVPGDTNGAGDIFVRDRLSAATERVSVDSSGAQGNDASDGASISADGRCVTFASPANNLVSGDTNAVYDVFLRDRQSGTTERVSVGSAGAQRNGDSGGACVSADGRYVAFASFASNLVPGDTNGALDVFRRDRSAAVTERMSVSSSGAQAIGVENAAISADGDHVAFAGPADELVPGDTNGRYDVFIRDPDGGPEFTALCDAGVGGVIACPCANPPSSLGRGCDNSALTGGAVLSAAGGTYLSSDSLVFTTSGEKPTALSIVAQWTGTSATGVVFGMGVRCTSGTLKRLYTKSAALGSITAPSFGAGDAQVSVRSAALGDTILAGQSRWYLVYYRDPIVLGGCPAASAFNATQTGVVAWSP